MRGVVVLRENFCSCPPRIYSLPGANNVPSKSCRDLCIDSIVLEFSCREKERVCVCVRVCKINDIVV